MVLSKKSKLTVLFLTVSLSHLFLFQNCSKTAQFSAVEGEEFGILTTAHIDDGLDSSCSFNGQLLSDGESVMAYQSSSVPYGSECISESRLCSKGVLSGSYPSKSCQVLPKEAASLCSEVSQVIGDMRTDVQPGSSSSDYSTLEFGTFADNYWRGNPETFDRKMEFYVENADLVSEFNLVQAAFDDWIAVSVNSHVVYYGPYTDKMTKLVVDLNTKKVEYAEGLVASAELSTSWNKILNIDIKPYLLSGKNTVNVRTIVAGAGESFLKFKYKTSCNN